MSRIVDVFVPLDASDEPLPSLISRTLGIPRDSLHEMRVLRRSLDARKAHALGHRLRVEIFTDGQRAQNREAEPPASLWPASITKPRVVIVGSGPAGAWAALRLAEAGVPSTILERGKAVQPRRHDLAGVQRGHLNANSNYCFGEGGAGTYSDGKLYTRTKDRKAVDQVLADLIRFGAEPDIAIESRPHVGSNKLPKVLTALRAFLESRGVIYKFSSALADVVVDRRSIHAVRTTDGDEIPADVVVLACGHSARDVYAWAASADLALERKGSAVGVRLEHPQPVIDRIQYGKAAHTYRRPSTRSVRPEPSVACTASVCVLADSSFPPPPSPMASWSTG